mmetsp:Transcript_64741/g.153074  ORF Transcript_64741/g.153074 Transcript_64741/m.153074 type:complete len:109 (+) Transcript_64741:79-405(+)
MSVRGTVCCCSVDLDLNHNPFSFQVVASWMIRYDLLLERLENLLPSRSVNGCSTAVKKADTLVLSNYDVATQLCEVRIVNWSLNTVVADNHPLEVKPEGSWGPRSSRA